MNCPHPLNCLWALCVKAFSFVALVLLLSASAGSGQQVRVEDVPPGGLDPTAVSVLPFSDAQRAALRDDLKSRDYARAETTLVNDIEHNPKSPLLLAFLGRIFFLDGKFLNCTVAMKKAEALAPLSDHDRFTLALCYIILNHRDWARPELEQLADLNPRDPLYPYWLGRIEYDAMQFKAAAAHLEKALALDPHFMKGAALCSREDLPAAGPQEPSRCRMANVSEAEERKPA